MAAENLALPSQEKNIYTVYFLKSYFNIFNILISINKLIIKSYQPLLNSSV